MTITDPIYQETIREVCVWRAQRWWKIEFNVQFSLKSFERSSITASHACVTDEDGNEPNFPRHLITKSLKNQTRKSNKSDFPRELTGKLLLTLSGTSHFPHV
jgi:hypothetical protein